MKLSAHSKEASSHSVNFFELFWLHSLDIKGTRTMIFYHHGAAIQPSVTRVGRAFVARASILEEDGEATSLGDLGVFASKDGAYRFAIRCAFAFVDGQTLPLPPFKVEQH
jgi:hypothetical protein